MPQFTEWLVIPLFLLTLLFFLQRYFDLKSCLHRMTILYSSIFYPGNSPDRASEILATTIPTMYVIDIGRAHKMSALLSRKNSSQATGGAKIFCCLTSFYAFIEKHAHNDTLSTRSRVEFMNF